MNHNLLKLGLLAVLWCLCLGTWFTSPSIMMGNPNMPTLKPRLAKVCKVAMFGRDQCLKDKQLSCDDHEQNVKKCETAAARAYQHVNLGGCPFEIKFVDLCEAEWCRGGGFNMASCRQECAGVRESLEACTQKHLVSYFGRFGLKENGTLRRK